MIVGCYSLHLYCDNVPDRPWQPGDLHDWSEFPHEYDGDETGAQARKRARKKGWALRRDGTALCPKCNPRSPKFVRGGKP
jgi:hypothetical protein